jgi:hypothetical protein
VRKKTASSIWAACAWWEGVSTWRRVGPIPSRSHRVSTRQMSPNRRLPTRVTPSGRALMTGVASRIAGSPSGSSTFKPQTRAMERPPFVTSGQASLPQEPHEGRTVQVIRPPEGVDDLSHRLAAAEVSKHGVAGVVCEWVVDDFAAIAILTPSGPKVHAHYSGMYHIQCQSDCRIVVCPPVCEPSTRLKTITA